MPRQAQSTYVRNLVDEVVAHLREHADPANAAPMAAYMKTTMPFYGVKAPERRAFEKRLKKEFAPADREAYEAAIRALWRRPHREEKYMAVAMASMFRQFHTPEVLPLCEKLIREGAWWDFVDEVAGNVVAPTQRRYRAEVRPVMDRWIEDDDMWIRRAAILSQLKLKADTDADQLADYCRRCLHEKEFFIRKAIGWALRDYSYTNPEFVRSFVETHRDRLSGLSIREALKALERMASAQ
ncbi:MAG: DNA alkylation repair protein [Deltaproteobacteria bacterium]|nr:DNA alkylation repair protein [Deltaproteobacteria bacterium]